VSAVSATPHDNKNKKKRLNLHFHVDLVSDKFSLLFSSFSPLKNGLRLIEKERKAYFMFFSGDPNLLRCNPCKIFQELIKIFVNVVISFTCSTSSLSLKE